jgi:hypothetical protein
MDENERARFGRGSDLWEKRDSRKAIANTIATTTMYVWDLGIDRVGNHTKRNETKK